ADEATLFTSKVPLRGPLAYDFLIHKLFGEDAPKILAQYPAAVGSAKQAFDALVTDLVFVCPARHQAAKTRAHQPHVYRYQFTHVTARARARGLGATHGNEI